MKKIAFQGKFSVPLDFDLQRTTDILWTLASNGH